MYRAEPIEFPYSPPPQAPKWCVVDTEEEFPSNVKDCFDSRRSLRIFQGTKEQCEDFAWLMSEARKQRRKVKKERKAKSDD